MPKVPSRRPARKPQRKGIPAKVLIPAIALALAAAGVSIGVVMATGGGTSQPTSPPIPGGSLIPVPAPPLVQPAPVLPPGTPLPTAALYTTRNGNETSLNRMDLRTGRSTEVFRAESGVR